MKTFTISRDSEDGNYFLNGHYIYMYNYPSLRRLSRKKQFKVNVSLTPVEGFLETRFGCRVSFYFL